MIKQSNKIICVDYLGYKQLWTFVGSDINISNAIINAKI